MIREHLQHSRFLFFLARASLSYRDAICSRLQSNNDQKAPARKGELQLRESVCSLFEKTMRINNRLGGFSSRQTIEQFHEARLVRITHGGFAIWLDPFGMLDPEVVVNLLPEFRVGVDLMRRGRWLVERFMGGAGPFV